MVGLFSPLTNSSRHLPNGRQNPSNWGPNVICRKLDWKRGRLNDNISGTGAFPSFETCSHSTESSGTLGNYANSVDQRSEVNRVQQRGNIYEVYTRSIISPYSCKTDRMRTGVDLKLSIELLSFLYIFFPLV